GRRSPDRSSRPDGDHADGPARGRVGRQAIASGGGGAGYDAHDDRHAVRSGEPPAHGAHGPRAGGPPGDDRTGTRGPGGGGDRLGPRAPVRGGGGDRAPAGGAAAPAGGAPRGGGGRAGRRP